MFWVLVFWILYSTLNVLDGATCNITKERSTIANGLANYYLKVLNGSEGREKIRVRFHLPKGTLSAAFRSTMISIIRNFRLLKGWKTTFVCPQVPQKA